MATKLTRRIVRETFAREPLREERIIGVTVHLRAKGRRQRLTTTWREIFRFVIAAKLAAIRAEKAAAKKARKAGKR